MFQCLSEAKSKLFECEQSKTKILNEAIDQLRGEMERQKNELKKEMKKKVAIFHKQRKTQLEKDKSEIEKIMKKKQLTDDHLNLKEIKLNCK